MIWFRPYTLDHVRFFGASLPQHLGIEFTELGEDFLRGRMPVDDRTRQPFGILHGGASADFPLTGVLGIEIYRTESETPPEFLRGMNVCGAIVIWTVRGKR